MDYKDPYSSSLTRTDLFLYMGIILFWGTSWIAIRLHLGVVAPEVSLFWRFSAAAAIMFTWTILSGGKLLFPIRDHIWFFALALMFFSFNFILQYHGGAYIKSGLMAVIFSTTSIINLLLGIIILRQSVNYRVLAGGLVGFTGVCLMFWPELSLGEFSGDIGETGRNSLKGFLLCFSGTFLFCCGNMISAIIQKKGIPLNSATSWGIFYGALIVGLVSLIQGHPFIIEMTPQYILSLLWLIVGASVGAFFCYLSLLRRIGPARAGYTTVLFPVVALLISTFFEGYTWSLTAFTGMFMAVAGNFLILQRK